MRQKTFIFTESSRNLIKEKPKRRNVIASIRDIGIPDDNYSLSPRVSEKCAVETMQFLFLFAKAENDTKCVFTRNKPIYFRRLNLSIPQQVLEICVI